jgi:hypothetical protein
MLSLSNEKIKELVYTENVDSVEVAHYLARKYCNINDNEIKMMDIASNESWLFASEIIVTEVFGYKKNKTTMTDFRKKLAKEFKEGIDFEEVNRDHELVTRYYEILKK